MKTDKELLILAAKAAGIVGDMTEYRNRILTQSDPEYVYWSPLDDDGDALRLAVDLDMDISVHCVDKTVSVTTIGNHGLIEYEENQGADKHAATRRAIVRAAADIGESMQ